MNRSSIKDVLAKVPLFKELSTEELKRIVNIAITKTYPRGAYVFLQDDPLEFVFFIYSGKIKIYKNDSSGKEQIVSILEAGEMFPHAGFFRRGNYPAFSQVMMDSNLVAISISNFEQLLIRYPEVCVKLFRVMGEKILDLQNRLEAQILNNTYEQIIKLLLRISDTHGFEFEPGKVKLTSQFTNKELANMIGTTRETISRTLTKLKKKSLLNTTDTGNFIINIKVLEKELF